ncbi:endospore germination permease [Paenibacillus sp. CGMCC 1.16610]|uniref:Endospore germination permease n=1 Tax=Paenibacillus anseongense TaxID=2682845 RepID=A0ABW9UH34_9BACL|nr:MULTISPECIES: endospore germination permease [Paenibacillus]MBA2939814.1 endospore germination permease [Paenibacillus sp. CGMCC 1.16610]MVQ39474.1 endospore germination permease [Paenibacillus anseongense]
MEGQNRQITIIQTAIILISAIVGVGVLALSRFAVWAADSGAPLVTLFGFLVGLLGLWLTTKLGIRFPTQSIIQYSEGLIGNWVARIINLMIIVLFCFLAALASREFGEVVVTSVLAKTPLEVTVIVMLLLAALSARADITTFAYFHHFYFPIIIFPALLIVVFSLKDAHLINLLPPWGNDPKSIFKGGITMAALFQGSFVITIIVPAMRRPEKAMLASYIGISIAGALYLLIVIATVGVFGSEEIKKLVWPTLELAKTTSLPANILERLDGAFLAVWVTAVFTTLLSSYYLAINFMSQLLRLHDHRLFTFFLVPFIYVIAMFPQNLLQMYAIIQIIGKWGLVFTIVYPLILMIVAVIRQKKNI